MVFVVFIALLICGCVPIRTNGTTHYIVIGIGIVSVSNTNQYAASITSETAIGAYVSEDGGGIGYKSKQQIMVSTNADMTIEVFHVPFEKWKVDIIK